MNTPVRRPLGSTRFSWLLRQGTRAVVLLVAWGLAGCAGESATTPPPSCSGVVSLADGLTEVRATEGDVTEAARRFDSAAVLMEQTAPPAGLGDEWSAAAQALRYYAASAGDRETGRRDPTPHRSEQELAEWQAAFARITSHAMEHCGTGWRTPFDHCRSDPPPVGAESIRLLFPCRL